MFFQIYISKYNCIYSLNWQIKYNKYCDTTSTVHVSLNVVFLIKAVGITNQRETTVVWDKYTGEPLHNAIGKFVTV